MIIFFIFLLIIIVIITGYKFGGGDKNIMFVMFPGHGNTANDWGHDNKFLNKLREIGILHLITLPWYDMTERRQRAGLDNNKLFKLSDIDVPRYCMKIYNEIKQFKGKFIVISHSLGGLYAQEFVKICGTRCKLNIMLDSCLLGSSWWHMKKWDDKKMIEKYRDMTDAEFQKIMEKNELSSEISDIIIARTIACRLNNESAKVKIPTIHLRNFELAHEERWEIYTSMEKEFITRNPKLYQSIILFNKSHWIHYNPEVISQIICLIQNNI